MWKALIKRAFDILASGLGLLLLSPFLLPVALILRRESPGPILYRGPRLGRGGKPFNILKFRTMYERPETYNGPRLTARGDDRITPLGHWLRGTKLNELPQLWNVLVGDMSMVGPRPGRPGDSRIPGRSMHVLRFSPSARVSPALPVCYTGMKKICFLRKERWMHTSVISCQTNYASISSMFATIHSWVIWMSCSGQPWRSSRAWRASISRRAGSLLVLFIVLFSVIFPGL